jgi:hypothetical protein
MSEDPDAEERALDAKAAEDYHPVLDCIVIRGVTDPAYRLEALGMQPCPGCGFLTMAIGIPKALSRNNISIVNCF